MTAVLRTVFLSSVVIALVGAADPDTFAGTWKLNVSKSKFQSPAKKAHTVTIANGIA